MAEKRCISPLKYEMRMVNRNKDTKGKDITKAYIENQTRKAKKVNNFPLICKSILYFLTDSSLMRFSCVESKHLPDKNRTVNC